MPRERKKLAVDPVEVVVADKALLAAPPKPLTIGETAGMTKVLLSNATIAAGAETRLWPGLDVSKWDVLHLTVGADARGVANLNVRVLFSVPIAGMHCGGILTNSTVPFDKDGIPRRFEYTTPAGYGGTGFTMSVPVIAPVLYDVILRNTGSTPLETIYVALFAQEI
ncbi:MAG: hypothetical protein ABR616_04695 [Dermatophilaceae bacterium]